VTGTRRLLALAAAIVFVDTTFFAAVTPLLPELSHDYGLTKAMAGVLAAAYPAGTFAGALPGGWLAARAGVKPTVFVGLALMSVASLGFAFAGSAAVLVIARFVQGLGGAASWAGAFGWLVGAAPRERRAELIGGAMGSAIAGAMCGPVLGALAHALTPEAVFSAVSVVGVGLIAWAARTPAARPQAPATFAELAAATRDGRVVAGMWLVTLPGLLFGTIGVLAPLRLDALGAGATAIAACFLVAAGLEAVVSPLAGRVADRRGRLVPSLAGLGGAAVAMACLPWPGAAWGLGALVIVATPVIGILWTPAMALLSDGAEAHGLEQGIAFSLMNLAWSVGQTVGNAGSARLAESAGDALPYLLLCGLCAASFAALRGLALRRPAALG
jgi:MFS family permease